MNKFRDFCRAFIIFLQLLGLAGLAIKAVSPAQVLILTAICVGITLIDSQLQEKEQ